MFQFDSFRRFLFACLLAGLMISPAVFADDFDGPPIGYPTAKDDNCITRLRDRIEAGKTKLSYDDQTGWLKAVLAELGVPVSSQMLVFSKTSLQRSRISPRTPRALYFNDDVYLGYCQHGDVVEISAADPKLGGVFYSIDQHDELTPRIQRHTDNCLICHSSSHTQGVPGHIVRSVYPDATGNPLLASGSFRINHTSPLKNRWGGWYVTGTHGEQHHLGNAIFKKAPQPDEVDNQAGENVTDLTGRIKTEPYLTPHSDLVALMVLEHQAEGHNLITKANFLTRQALHYETSLNRELNEPAEHRWDSTSRRIAAACDPLVKYFLFSRETPLTHEIRGTSDFAKEFVQTGHRDTNGRSLKQLNLKTRLFEYPCSYLIESASFDALPTEARDYVLEKIRQVLWNEVGDKADDFAHLTPTDRTAIREILLAVKPNLPESWKRPPLSE